jgi:hypothetical protein
MAATCEPNIHSMNMLKRRWNGFRGSCRNMYVKGCQSMPCRKAAGETEPTSVSQGKRCCATKTTPFAIRSCLITRGVIGGPKPMPPE